MVGSRRLEPKSPAKPPAEGAGHCRTGAGVLAGLPEGLPSCSRVLGGKSPWSEDLFPYGFPDAQGVCVVASPLQKGRLDPTPES